MCDIHALGRKIGGHARYHCRAIQIQASIVRTQPLSHRGGESRYLSRWRPFVNQTLMPERSDETVWNAAGVKDEGRGITSLVHGLAMVIRPGVFEKNRLVADDASNILAVYGRFRGLREIPGRAWLLVKAGAQFSIHVRNDHPALNAARVV